MLDEVQKKLGTLVRNTWADDVRTRAALVKLYRDYSDGVHRAKMTAEMRKMLRIADDKTEQFNLNYCDMVVETMADRLKVSRIEGEDEAASMWAADLLRVNRFDALQMDVHEAAVRDGDTYVMAEWDNEARAVVLAHEPAYDGEQGMIVVYDRMGKKITAAVKVWFEGDERRVNLYFPDRVEKYRAGKDETGSSAESEALEFIEVAEWSPGVVPVVAWRNRGRSRRTEGISELAVIVPVQDALNRTLVSMVMTAELSAFQIRVAIGFPPPANLSPGMWVVIGEEGIDKDQVADAKTLEQAQLVPFISQAQFLIEQIGTVSRTPLPGFMGGDSQSGEALKQREVGLLSKVEKFQIRGGNSWEDLMALAAGLQNAFGVENAPSSRRWNCQWETAELRDDSAVIANAMATRELLGDRETVRLVANVYGYDEEKIEELQAEKAADAAAAMRALVPSFSTAEFEVA